MTDGRFLAATCTLAVALRLPLLALNVAATSDFGWYFDAARSIAAGQGYAEGGYPTAFWPVGWPGFLAGALWLLGPHVWVGQLLNLLLSTGAIALMRPVGRRLFPDPGVWRLAAVMIAVFPNQIAYVPLLSVEIFFEFLLLAGFLLLQAGPVFTAGLIFGVASLTKSQAVFLPAVLALPRPGRWLRTVLVSGVAMLLVILPWTARNYAVLGAVVPLSTNGGFTLLTGNNPTAAGGYTPNDALVSDLSKDPRDQVAMDQIAKQRALAWIKEHPTTFLRLIPAKLAGLWWGDGEAEWMYQAGYAGYEANWMLFRAVRVINQGFYLGLMALAIAGAPAMWRRRRSLPAWCWSGWLLAGYFSAISIVFSGQSRFHFSLMPFFAFYAAWTITILPRFQRALGNGPNAASPS